LISAKRLSKTKGEFLSLLNQSDPDVKTIIRMNHHLLKMAHIAERMDG
jgi:hypothetical protein